MVEIDSIEKYVLFLAKNLLRAKRQTKHLRKHGACGATMNIHIAKENEFRNDFLDAKNRFKKELMNRKNSFKVYHKDTWGIWIFTKYVLYIEDTCESLTEVIVNKKTWDTYNVGDYYIKETQTTHSK